MTYPKDKRCLSCPYLFEENEEGGYCIADLWNWCPRKTNLEEENEFRSDHEDGF